LLLPWLLLLLLLVLLLRVLSSMLFKVTARWRFRFRTAILVIGL